jgi:hypothetical protein
MLMLMHPGQFIHPDDFTPGGGRKKPEKEFPQRYASPLACRPRSDRETETTKTTSSSPRVVVKTSGDGDGEKKKRGCKQTADR